MARRQFGFTLVELLTTIVVIGILSAYTSIYLRSTQLTNRQVLMKNFAAQLRMLTDTVNQLSSAALNAQDALANVNVRGIVDPVKVAYGYPTASADGIVRIVENRDRISSVTRAAAPGSTAAISANDIELDTAGGGCDPAAHTCTFVFHKTKDKARCNVVYKYDASSASNVPEIKQTIQDDGCAKR